MRKEQKSDRQKRVLEMVVRHYAATAEPVGSMLVSKDMGLSSATIRNIMYELEEMGFITHPHTSAGRIPTDKGYRLYVDSLLEADEFPTLEEAYMEETLSRIMSSSIEDVILNGLQLCSQTTSQTCLALFPHELDQRLYYYGAYLLVEQPEFQNVQKISCVLKALEEKKGLLELMGQDLRSNGVKVHIGNENNALGLGECTLITANYGADDKTTGSLGIIGPMRMEYDKVIPAVNSIAVSMTRLLDSIL